MTESLIYELFETTKGFGILYRLWEIFYLLSFVRYLYKTFESWVFWGVVNRQMLPRGDMFDHQILFVFTS